MDVRRDAFNLSAFAVGAVELLNGQFERPAIRLRSPPIAVANVVADHHDLLDSPFAESARITNDQSSAIITDHACEDLRSTCAELVDQDNERAVPGSAFNVIVVVLDSEDFFYLNNWASVDKQAGEGLGFVKEATAVTAKVNNYGIDAALFVIGQDLTAIDGCTDRVLIAAK